MTAVPTPQDEANAALRQQIARRQRVAYTHALGFCLSLFGPGWEPTGRHDLVEHEEMARCRRTGDTPTPAATVYTASRGTDKRHFVVEDGTAREVASYEAGFGAMLTEPHPTERFTVKGVEHQVHRYGLYWSGFEPGYRPKSAAQLAAARERRQQRALEAEAKASPLFADQVLAEGLVPRKGLPR